jgi:uncharacterized protein (TIGR03382 family)
MRYIISSLAILLTSNAALAGVVGIAPSPEIDLGLSAVVMAAGAAYWVRRRRR